MTPQQTPKTVLITGASTGIGLATALRFQEDGWNVIATMRRPKEASALDKFPQILKLPLDVTDTPSIEAAREAAVKRFGTVDVVVNNAGYGLAGVFESTSEERIRKQFETNFFGLLAVTRAFLPHFRAQKKGTFINISSIGGKMTFPLYSSYHATKHAVEGFSESLQHEVKQFGIQVKLVEPGAVKTDFSNRSGDFVEVDSTNSDTGFKSYKKFSDQLFSHVKEFERRAEPPRITADVILKAAKDSSERVRYISGTSAKLLLALRWMLPNTQFNRIVRKQLKVA